MEVRNESKKFYESFYNVIGIFDSNNYQLMVLFAKQIYRITNSVQIGMGVCLLLYVLCCGLIMVILFLIHKVFNNIHRDNSVFTTVNTKYIKMVIWLVIILELNFDYLSGIIISLVLWALIQIINYACQLQEEVDTMF